MLDSFEEFRTAVHAALRDKIAERIDTQREYISNSLLQGETEQPEAAETQSNADEN